MMPRVLLESLLTDCVALNASDIHLAPGLPPRFRHHGMLQVAAGHAAVSAEGVRAVAAELLAATVVPDRPAPDLDTALGKRGALDGAITSAAGVRFRFNLFRTQAQVAIALRRLEDRFRTLEELGMPVALYELCHLRDGLVIVSGPTGSGKSTTIGTLLDRVNQGREGHIVTIEDPIEYLHASARCIVNQRQVGLDSPSFNDALVDAMRQDPDVILVGEIRDLDTIRTAIVAAETGHLVFTTLHAGDCVGAVERLVAVFPADEQEGIRRQLSLTLRAVVAQRLLVRARPDAQAEGSGLTCVAASEVLKVTPAIANLIANGKSAQIYSAMETGMAQGMRTMEQDLARLWMEGHVSEAAALAMARNPALVRDRAMLHPHRTQTGTNGLAGRTERSAG